MIFSAYVTNLGKYNEGALVGEWIDFPCSQTDFEKALDRIGVSDKPDKTGRYYEEYFFTDYDYPIVNCDFGEYESYRHLNEVAEKLDRLNDTDLFIVNTYLKEVDNDLADIIDSVEDSIFYEGCNTLAECAYYFINEYCGGPENLDKKTLEECFDYEAYGEMMDLEATFVKTNRGYVEFF